MLSPTNFMLIFLIYTVNHVNDEPSIFYAFIIQSTKISQELELVNYTFFHM